MTTKKLFGKKTAVGLWAICLLVTSAVASADQAETLKLNDIVRLALQESHELKASDREIAMAAGDLAQAKGGRWAQLDLTGVTGPVSNATSPVVQGNSIQIHEHGVGIFGRLDFTISQPLYTFGKISNRLDAAALGVEIQRAAKEKKKADVILATTELYYALIVARQGKEAAGDAEAFVQDARKKIRAMIKAGSTNATETDLYRLEAYEAEVRQFKIRAESGAQMAQEALRVTIGYPENRPFRPDASELPQATDPSAPKEEYIRTALERRPELEQVRKGVQAQKSMADAAEADLYPSVFAAATGSFAGAPDRDKFESTYFPDQFNHSYAGVVLGAQWHFDLGIGKGKLDKARAEHQKMVQTKDYAEQNIPLEVTKYYQDVVDAQKSSENYRTAATASRKWIVSAFANFDLGVGTARDMFEAIDKYGKNQGEYLQSLYSYHVSNARLAYASGKYRDSEW